MKVLQPRRVLLETRASGLELFGQVAGLCQGNFPGRGVVPLVYGGMLGSSVEVAHAPLQR